MAWPLRPIADLDAYRDKLQTFVYASGTTMKPIFTAARRLKKRVAYAEGEDERVLRAAQIVVDEASGAAHAHRATQGHCRARGEVWPAPEGGPGLATWSTLSKTTATATLANLPPHDRTQGRDSTAVAKD